MRKIRITKKFSGDFCIVSLTKGTCTEIAVNYFIQNAFSEVPEVVYVPTFDEAKLLCERNRNYIMLLPHIHHLCGELETDIHWETHHDQVFSLENPPLFLAQNDFKNNKCCTLPTLRNLVKDDFDFISARNTQDAADATIKGLSSFCITNLNGVKKNNLKVVRELKKINVIWIPFSYFG